MMDRYVLELLSRHSDNYCMLQSHFQPTESHIRLRRAVQCAVHVFKIYMLLSKVQSAEYLCI
jgi:hypothetical protein